MMEKTGEKPNNSRNNERAGLLPLFLFCVSRIFTADGMFLNITILYKMLCEIELLYLLYPLI